jgi:hypothetical protein
MEPRDCGDSSSLVSKDNGQGDMVLPGVWGCTACTPSVGRRGVDEMPKRGGACGTNKCSKQGIGTAGGGPKD